MVDITFLKQKVADAEKYLNDVVNNNNPPCVIGSFTGCSTLISQFAASRDKDYARAKTELENAKQALEQALTQVQDETKTIGSNLTNTIQNIIPNTNINQLGEQIQKPESKGLILIAGIVAAALILK